MRGPVAAGVLAVQLGSAAPTAQAQAPFGAGYVDVGAEAHGVSGGYGAWRGASAQLVLPRGARDVWYGELALARRFATEATFASLGNQHVWSDRTYSFVAVGASGGPGFFFPRVRADAVLSHKWLASRALVSSAGIGWYDYKDAHSDLTASVAASYYFPVNVVLEGGGRMNFSTPGAVVAPSGWVAVSAGREGMRTGSLRIAAGREAYEIIGVGNTQVDFASGSARATVRQWLRPHVGVSVAAELYQNPAYDRAGGRLGVFRHF